MNKIYLILSVLILLVSCSSLLYDRSYMKLIPPPIKCQDSIDYCSEKQKLKKWNPHKSDAPADSVEAYGIAALCCDAKREYLHNKDSLTTDSCLCQKRLSCVFDLIPLDSYVVSYKPASNRKNGIFTFYHKDIPGYRKVGGIARYIISDSCRIIKLIPEE